MIYSFHKGSSPEGAMPTTAYVGIIIFPQWESMAAL